MTKLSKIIFEKELKNKDIAKKLGVSESHISLLKNGQRRMSSDILMSLCEILDCEPHEIYEPYNPVRQSDIERLLEPQPVEVD